MYRRRARSGALREALARAPLDRDGVLAVLSAESPSDVELVRRAACDALLRGCGPTVYLRGLVEFSNRCSRDCHYCGIRRSNRRVRRYTLRREEVVRAARWCADRGFGSVVLQSGERRDERFVSFVERTVRAVKEATRSSRLPNGVGVTLSVGEQGRDAYERFREAGAHRYLLRIETSSPRLFAAIHPPDQRWEDRARCLGLLRDAGFQVGTGVMVGLPGQTLEDLADDVMFFRERDVDMVGLGPYIPHRGTPLAARAGGWSSGRALALALRMVAAVRLALPDVNIASTTALQALHPQGRELGLSFGANVVMPQATPLRVRRHYQLYEGKPCLDDDAERCAECLERRVASIGRTIGLDAWGDSPRALRRARP